MTDHIFVFSHRRSGTHLAIDSIINNFKPFHGNPKIRDVTLERVMDSGNTSEALDKMLSHAEDRPCIFKCHASGNVKRFFQKADPNARKWLLDLIQNGQKIYVYRDGRDVMTSLYHYMCSYSERVAEMSFSEFLRMPYAPEPHLNKEDLTPVHYWKYHVESWCKKEDVLWISFRDMVEQYERTLDRISAHVNVERNPRIMDIRLANAKKPARRTLKERLLREPIRRPKTSSVFPRKGKRGDWRNHFSQEDKKFFMEVAGDTLKKAGFAKDQSNA